MLTDDLTYFEKRLISELERIESEIKELNSEKFALQRQLAKARAERTGLADVSRKNSHNRHLAESSIIDTLKKNSKEVTTGKLLSEARNTNFDLKDTTFRSYLHRMKKNGLIKTGSGTGRWLLVTKDN
ncbi:hypothetical protein [Jiella mangrovi]|uniref:Uncharacterized protein n=1 Tax=Jiella mangrovi TaxID=2821407 RepID=A0ABS4BNI5_9HYPH|nr:hypothetical protein [Jiella mangrovi]MBP0618312.1 hypothetical protein [Jiella mangrovi]